MIFVVETCSISVKKTSRQVDELPCLHVWTEFRKAASVSIPSSDSKATGCLLVWPSFGLCISKRWGPSSSFISTTFLVFWFFSVFPSIRLSFLLLNFWPRLSLLRNSSSPCSFPLSMTFAKLRLFSRGHFHFAPCESRTCYRARWRCQCSCNGSVYEAVENPWMFWGLRPWISLDGLIQWKNQPCNCRRLHIQLWTSEARVGLSGVTYSLQMGTWGSF